MNAQYFMITFAAINVLITAGGIVWAIGRFSNKLETLEDKVKDRREEDEKMFEKLNGFSKEFFARIGSLEAKQAAQEQINSNVTQQYAEIKLELSEIKRILLAKN